MRHRGPILVAVTAGGIAISGCAQLLGLSDYQATASSGRDSGAECRSLGPPEPCGGCVRENCCAEAAACEKDSDCKKFAACRSACPLDDAECRARCPPGAKTAAVRRYMSCTLSNCRDCYRCGDIGAAFGPDCAQCQSDLAKGCPEATACLDNVECRGFLACTVDRCPTWDTDPACRISCSAEHPDARDSFLAWARTPVSACDACGWGEHWDCTDFSSPRGKAGEKTAVRLHISGTVGPLTVRHCFNAGGCPADPSAAGDGGVMSIEVDQPDYINPDYFEVENDGPLLLAYPSRRWLGGHADMTIFGITALLYEPVAADSGTVIVAMGDCIGSLESARPEGSGATIKIDGQPDGIYLGPGGWFPSRGSGSFAEFDKVPAALQTVRGLDPGGRVVAAKRVWVRNGAVTLVYFNFPVTEQ